MSITIFYTMVIVVGLIVLSILWLLYSISSCLSIGRRSAPYVPISESTVGPIVDLLNPPNGSVIYDLGCGDARVLIECARRFPDVKCVGVDRHGYPLILAWVRSRLAKLQGRVRLVKADVFSVDLSSATHIYTYLFPAFMEELLPKLEKELRPGTILVACDFPLPRKTPEKKFDAEGDHRLYVYRF